VETKLNYEELLTALYPADLQISISVGFLQEYCFRGIESRANLATGFQIAYTNREANKDPPRYDSQQNTFLAPEIFISA
jgi:hypothetical protein